MLLFRLPFGATFYTTNSDKTVSAVSFTSFDCLEKISIPGALVEIQDSELENLHFNLQEKSNFEGDETQEHYLEKIENAISIIKENKLPKLVIARKKTVNVNIDLIATFRNLCKAYPSAFVYIFEQDGISWIGAFSELLGKFDKKNSIFTTMSLAGTLPIDEEWTEKELEEQKPVTQYIASILSKYSNSVQQSETYDHLSGNIKHLRTDFQINIEDDQLKNVIEELHPTPAVCGIPKKFCIEKILQLENFPRELYGGYSSIETEDYRYFFVNLRCGKVWQNAIELFAGGGITALSNPQKEWKETELKMQALEKNIATF